MTIISHSPQETIEIGRHIGRHLIKGLSAFMYGELGAGKTMLIKGVGSVFGIPERDITSATYTIIAEYEGAVPFYHIDLYRLDDIKSIEEAGVFECIGHGKASAVEWAEKLDGVISGAIRVDISYVDNDTRQITIQGIDEKDWDYNQTG
ncbi:tRNA (adenosine(37)-N6)-threonylcarbamoyltransferase complex ATPase subunit type 1 TsaE [Candidatus Magnetominusculus xianensis]|uniref:tRNA threonylcarbamoyladenosine biosynthesis protein TsaE n=1 Tax=Candidatus Magnetominusculus xianensis TaxID=1748249 RepID=A0ABR5SB50_9BACT|nr:tRNA (adenosine(37)-N6)-threonylcarbamoyltransferase complex ATPase subunit type 1 TsaE [Candidatus Magnetominusculus xianensis]KWT75640.1 tRNA threonylcarbamoyladenosine biosynthesis protein TsaE [Candidatus Magnetominusculus xianensis]MBF0403722.1 tRNA (adenosine(37)-N6)-threonylcarbamoyltransferase complex ATPase subunit type 1 TsaE [Nitrospirota bacterium]